MCNISMIRCSCIQSIPDVLWHATPSDMLSPSLCINQSRAIATTQGGKGREPYIILVFILDLRKIFGNYNDQCDCAEIKGTPSYYKSNGKNEYGELFMFKEECCFRLQLLKELKKAG